MRLLNCQIQNVRLHGDLELTFSPRLTLIGGPNESGKSTLVEALHRALFLKASSSGAPVDALQSRLHMGQPVVQIGFEAKGDTWTLRKRFSGTTGQVTLKAESSSSPLTGPAAEDVLAELLGVGEIVSSKQAKTVLPGRWAHLWVRQGLAGDDLLATDKSSYDFDQLRLQLERSGGAAVQQSALDQRVEQRIKDALDENFNSRGTKKHSPLYQREEALSAATARMEMALDRLSDYEDASEQLADLCEELEQLQAKELPSLLESQKLLQEGAQAVDRLDAAIGLTSKSLEPIRLRHEAAQQTLQQLDDLQAEIAQRQTTLAALEANASGAESREAQLLAAEQQRRQGLAVLGQQRDDLDQRLQVLQRLVERNRTAEALARQSAELEKLRQESTKRQSLEQQLGGLPGISKASLQELRQLEQQLRDTQTRLGAMAAGVKLLKADQTVRLDGQPLQVGDEQRLSAVFQLQVGDGVVLEIAPGGGQALEDLEQRVRNARDQLTSRLAALNVASVAAAEELLEQRNGLEQQLAALADVPADHGHLEDQHASLGQRLAELDGELQTLAQVRQAMEQEQPMPEALSELQALQQQVSETSKHTLAALGSAENELEAARSALQAFQKQRISEASQLEVVRSELTDRQQRLEPLISQHGDRNTLAAQLTGLGEQRQEAEAELNRLKAERAAISSQDPEREQQRLQEQLENLTRRQEELLDQRGAAKQRCDSISSQAPFAAVEQARLQLETAEADLQQLQRVIAAHRLLRDTFQEVQADVSSRYSEPLARAIGDYLRPLVPDGQVARLSYDQSKGFQGLQLRRGQEYYDFESLSGGMREQLAAALRLSMADVLKEAHDGCLPLVFDDAFTNSDPERVDLVKRMLGSAVDRGLQVILLTCDPAAYGSFADQVVEMGSA